MEIPILMYHHVRPDHEGPVNEFVVSPETFERQVALLVWRGYRGVSVQEAARRARGTWGAGGAVPAARRARGTWGAGGAVPAARHVLSPKECVFTFDDGYLDVWRHAAPILERYGFVGTVFVVASHVGDFNGWSSGEESLMSLEQLKKLLGRGWTIGSHTSTHPHLLTRSEEEQKQEINESKKQLEAMIGDTVNTFAYPYNEWDHVTRKLVWGAGYDFGCAVSSPARTVFVDPYAIRRVFVKRSDSLWAFRRKVSRWYLRYRGLMKH